MLSFQRTGIILLFFIVAQFSGALNSHAQTAIIKTKAPQNISRMARLPTPVQIMAVTDSKTLVDKQGRVFTLSNIDIPEDQNIAALETLRNLIDKSLIHVYQTRNEKYGRLNRLGQSEAQLVRKIDDVWIQGSLIENGLARVNPQDNTPDMTESLLALEQKAREKKLGLWSKKNAVLNGTTAQTAINSFAIIEDKVSKVGIQRSGIYLNFSQDWKNDFTVFIPNALRTAFAKKNVQLTNVKDQTIRVRGIVQQNNGPFITVTSPSQLEFLSRPTPATITKPTPPSVQK